jgi:hypothetical protein
VYEPIAQGDWLEDEEELPPRPRRRLLAPIPLTLLAVLLIACGFIGGVLVEKGQTSSTSTAGSGLAARFAALRGGATGASSSASAATSSGARGFAGLGGAGGATTGTVAFIVGSTLYVTNAEGNTVKVDTSAASSVTKTVKASVAAIHPGETVVVTGATGKNGAVTAESIRVGSTAGGFGSLFGGERSGAAGAGTGSKGSSEQSLFGG